MDLEKIKLVQATLNNHTLHANKVYVTPAIDKITGPVVTAQPAHMSLGQRDGEVLRQHSPAVQLIDMYQWAGNRELQELLESIETNRQNARVEIVDIMHFDLSVLILVKATGEEIMKHYTSIAGSADEGSLSQLIRSRMTFDDLQLRKWWTTKTVSFEEIRSVAIDQFARLLDAALQYPLFDNMADIEATYLKKVEVNYNRIMSGYNHVTQKEMGNDTIK